MALYALTVFWGAFLLFLVQPLIGKYILPWFGGTPGVWTACLLFFQCLLLAGYSYAHCLNHFLPPRKQAWVHGAYCYGVCTLPITPSEALQPDGEGTPVWAILKLLRLSLGVPYMVSLHRPIGAGLVYYVPGFSAHHIGCMRYPMSAHYWRWCISVCGGALEHTTEQVNGWSRGWPCMRCFAASSCGACDASGGLQ